MRSTLPLIFIFIAGITLYAQAPAGRISLQPCEVPGARRGTTVQVLCASYEVFENRTAKSGRKISLKIIVFPATGPKKDADPLFYIPGGPGSSATEDAPYMAETFAGIRDTRDLVFVDQRGTGGSNPLVCDLFPPGDIPALLSHWNPPAAVKRCRTTLEKTSDLSLYTTSIAADDLDEVRKALGLAKINLAGSSYGTRAVLEYIRKYGANVRTAFLHGVAPADQFMPEAFPGHTERALQGVLSECEADDQCRKAFPDPKSDARAVLARLMKGPVEVEVMIDKKPVTVSLNRDIAGEAVRYALYSTSGSSRLPVTLNAAANGNFKPLTEAALFFRRNIVSTGATGLYLSITCAEDVPFAKGPRPEDEKTFLGSYRLREQREACAEWPKSVVEDAYRQPIRSDVPTLIYTGQWDPVTPPEYGERVASRLPHSLHLVIPSGGHSFNGVEGVECVDAITTQFVKAGTTKGLETSCIKTLKRRGFELRLRQ